MSKFITHIAYAGENLRPTIIFSDGRTYEPLGKTLSITFDLSQRYCIGWHDLITGENHPCPEQATTEKKFEICPACQRRTGFNPAFYHANTVSEKQEARNAKPHRLYLAYMGNDYIKVGISWEKRGLRRLLDQGARAGLILQTFPTALIARQYEERIARLKDVHETTSTRTKLALLADPFDKRRASTLLLQTKQHIQDSLDVSFSGDDVIFFDSSYAFGDVPSGTITLRSEPITSGHVEALVGDILLTRYDDRMLALPLKQFVGYEVEITDTIVPLDLEPQQMQLL